MIHFCVSQIWNDAAPFYWTTSACLYLLSGLGGTFSVANNTPPTTYLWTAGAPPVQQSWRMSRYVAVLRSMETDLLREGLSKRNNGLMVRLQDSLKATQEVLLGSKYCPNFLVFNELQLRYEGLLSFCLWPISFLFLPFSYCLLGSASDVIQIFPPYKTETGLSQLWRTQVVRKGSLSGKKNFI